MAPARVYPAVERQMVASLAECRRRGCSFAEAWRIALHAGGRVVLTSDPDPPELAVRWPSDRPARVEAKEAILATEDAYRRAYAREPPTAADRAVLELRDLLAELEAARPVDRSPAAPAHGVRPRNVSPGVFASPWIKQRRTKARAAA